MIDEEQKQQLGKHLKPGDDHYRAYVGPPQKFDLVGAMQFQLLTSLGLREEHTLLDIGCGSLRAGKLFIPYLLPAHYFGMEPNDWLIKKGIEKEMGQDLIDLKKPTFSNDEHFTFTTFEKQFDFMIAQSIYSHATAAQVDRSLEEAKKVLAPKGLFAVTFVLGDTDYEGDEWVYPGCVTFTQEFIHARAAQHGFVAKQMHKHHPNGQTWFVFAHTENPEAIPDVYDEDTYMALKTEYDAIRMRLTNIEQHPIGRAVLSVYRKFRKS
jgi:SAM-dependent methyltransferase